MNLFIVVGCIIGFATGKWTGLIIGGFVGHWISRALRTVMIKTVQTRFLDATFAVMGAVCKADGQITGEEIRIAEALFDRLRLSPEARRSAKDAFNRGKEPGFDLDDEVAGFAKACRGQRPIIMMFMQVQLAAITADGDIHPAEHKILVRIARGLGLSEAEVLRLEATLRTPQQSSRNKLDDAYAVFAVDSNISDSDLKKAYRKLMSENHPDKLASRGLPESMRQMAEEKTRNITAAYDVIKTARGLA